MFSFRVVPAVLLLGALGLPASATDVVVGSGSPASCNEAAFTSAVGVVNASGGTITFNCGGPATITLTSQKVFQNPANHNLVYTIDGGGLVTLSGGGTTRILLHTTGTLNVRNITLAAGRAQGSNDNASGGAIRSDGSVGGVAPVHLNLTNVTFSGSFTSLTVAPAPPFSPFDYGGGALFTRFGIVNISNCAFNGNLASNTSGGAIHGRASTLSIVGSTFTGNISNGGGFGGAIWLDRISPTPAFLGGSFTVASSTFTNNTSRNQGGAIAFYVVYPEPQTISFDTVSVIGNQVTDSSGTYLGTRAFGGGLHGDGGTVTIAKSTFANNVVHSNAGGGSGGGLSLSSSGAVNISNSTFSNNRAEGATTETSGGGLLISANAQPFLITHSTIAFNVAGFTGGGIASGTSGTLRNTIVAQNDATGFPSPFQDQCSSQLTNGGGVLEFPANNPPCVSGVIAANPLLAPLASNGGFSQTHLPQAGSPAIDAGACVLATDQRGIPRPQGPACDLGAVEIVVPTPATNFFTLTPCRSFDTRQPGGPTGGFALGCGINHVFTLTGGACGVPAGAKAVAANVTVTQPSAQGNLIVFPAGFPPPLTSVVNYIAGATRGNNAIIPLSAGQVAVRCAPSGSTHVILDVNGYFQ